MLDRTASTFSQRLPKRLRRARQTAAEAVDVDIETNSELDLRKVGVFKYATDPSTDVRCVAYSVNGGPVHLWRKGEPVPQVFRQPPKLVRAHQAVFEHHIIRYVLHRRYPKWAPIPLSHFDCTRVRALVLALPPKLENLAVALGLEHRKDPTSQRLMLAMARPRKARKNENPALVHWHSDPEKLERLAQRCISDVEIEQEADSHLPPLPDTLRKQWLLDCKINQLGIPIDLRLAHAARELIQQLLPEANAEMARRTGGAIPSVNMVGKILPYVQARGFKGRSLRRSIVPNHLDNLDANTRGVLELRLDNGATSFRKIDAIIARTCPDGRARDGIDFYKAGTGRAAGVGIQFQNLKRPSTKNVEAAVDVVLSRNLKRLKAFSDKPLVTISDVIRPTIASKSGELLISDFNNIEPRNLGNLAGDNRLLDAFAEQDASPNNPEREVYIRFAADDIFHVKPKEITKAQRQLAKTAFLAFMYAGGLVAWRNFLPNTLSDDEVLRLRDTWRKRHPAITKLWYRLNKAAIFAVKHPGELVRCGLLDLWVTDDFLFLELPSKRQLAYPYPTIVKNSFGEDAVLFFDNQLGKFAPCRFGQGAYISTWIENATQGAARDVLYEALARISRAGHLIVAHIHDEVIVEAAKGTVDIKAFNRLMVARPRWCLSMPIACETHRNIRYIKP